MVTAVISVTLLHIVVPRNEVIRAFGKASTASSLERVRGQYTIYRENARSFELEIGAREFLRVGFC